jgi:anaphase-promoting complex subunit 6
MALCRQQLANEFGMSDNPDVLYGFADVLFHQYRYSECYAITSRFEFFHSILLFNQTEPISARILEKTSIHMATLPLHIACMQHLPHLHPKLFLLAHELVEKEPEAPISWYAVGVWYVFTGKYHEARKYFA